MVKPDFRAVAASRLQAERSKGLSASVLRLLNSEEATAPQADEVAISPVEAVAIRPVEAVDLDSRRPPEIERVEALLAGFSRGMGGPGAPEGSVAEVDAATGLASPRAWARVLHSEEDRFARHGRPVTIVLAELDGLDSLAARLGREVADGLILPVADAMGRNTRAGDVVARTGGTSFAGLLPETDEIDAINYVDRVRSACDTWLGDAAFEVRLAIGWAQPPAGGRFADAMCLAVNRLNADRRGQDVG